MACKLCVEYEGFESGGVIPRGNENYGYQYDPVGNLMVRTERGRFFTLYTFWCRFES
jgi:hypothetical protein